MCSTFTDERPCWTILPSDNFVNTGTAFLPNCLFFNKSRWTASLPRVKLTRSSLGRRYEPIRPLGTDDASEPDGTTGDPESDGVFDTAFILFISGVPCRLCICVPCLLCIPKLGDPVLFDKPTELSGGPEVTFFDWFPWPIELLGGFERLYRAPRDVDVVIVSLTNSEKDKYKE